MGERPDLLEAAATLALEWARAARTGIHGVTLAGEDAVLKCSPLRGKAALRWGLKHVVFRRRLPRVNEHRNLAWLTERLFLTPVPLVAGAFVRAGIPRWQFLVTRRVADAVPFEAWLPAADARERAVVLEEIAREVARMHALHFLHHDLWPRNLMVLPPGGLSRVVFLDAWAGGPPPQLRPLRYDLACFTRGCAGRLEGAEIAGWLEHYQAERAALA